MTSFEHTALVADALEFLAKAGYFAYAHNTGAVKIENRFIRYGQKGSGDIMCIMPLNGYGIFCSIECKTGVGRQSKEQKIFQIMVEKNGGIYWLIRTLDDLKKNIKSLYDKSTPL